jgi:hypothetical protein
MMLLLDGARFDGAHLAAISRQTLLDSQPRNADLASFDRSLTYLPRNRVDRATDASRRITSILVSRSLRLNPGD